MLLIRKYKEGDYKQVEENLREAGLFDETWDSEKNVNGMVAKDPGSIIVAEEAEKVVGSVFLVYQGPKLVYLFRLVVKKEYRGKGIASKLIEKAYEIAKNNGVEEIGMYVDSSNKDLHEFYGKRDFKRSKSTYYYMWKDI